jgi:hypothetical protein
LWIEFNYRGSDNPVIVLQDLFGQTIEKVSVSRAGPVCQHITKHDVATGVYLLTIQGEQVFLVKKGMIKN